MILLGYGKENYNGNTLSVDELLDISTKIARISKDYPEITLSFPFQTPLFLKYLGNELNTDLGLCYSKCKSGICEFSLEPDGSLFPCIYISKDYICETNHCLQENNLLEYDFKQIVGNAFFDSVKNKLNEKAILDSISPCNKCPYNIELGLCRPCTFQHSVATDDFHKNHLCEAILRRTNNVF